MKDELDEDMLPEYDFSNAVRGKFADRWTPEEREVLLRESSHASVRSLQAHALEEVRGLESALFVFLVLAGARRGRHLPHSLRELVQEMRVASPLEPGLEEKLGTLVDEYAWLVQPRTEPYTVPGSLTPVLDRLDAAYGLARELKRMIETRLQQHLAGAGLSRQEIEQKTEETAKLWLAA
jgi:hypothetical protein